FNDLVEPGLQSLLQSMHRVHPPQLAAQCTADQAAADTGHPATQAWEAVSGQCLQQLPVLQQPLQYRRHLIIVIRPDGIKLAHWFLIKVGMERALCGAAVGVSIPHRGFPAAAVSGWQCQRPMLTLAVEIKAPQTAVPEESPMLHEASVRSAG